MKKIIKTKNKLTQNILALSALTFSVNTLAIQNGEDVTSDEYEEINYIVNILNSSNELCGGQIIAGNWLLTARHCTDSWDNDDSGSAYDDEAVDGDTMTVSIYQGLGGRNGYANGDSRLVYSGDATLYTFGNSDEVEEVITDLVTDSDIENSLETSTYYYKDEDTLDTVAAYINDNDSIGADVALIKLTESIPYKHTLKIALATDYDELGATVPTDFDDVTEWVNDQVIYPDQTFTMYGFGLDENDDKVYTMQTSELVGQAAPFSLKYCYYIVYYVEADYDSDTDKIDCDDFTLSDYTSLDDFDYVSAIVSFAAKSEIKVDAGVINSGDSGTALIIDNTAYGVVHANSILNTYSNFQSFVGLSDWMMEKMDTLNAPDEIEYLTTDSVDSISIDVQNISADDKSLDITILESATDVTLDTGDCSDTLESMDSCTVTITFDDEEGDFTVQLSDTKSTVVSFVDTYSGEYSDGSDSDDSIESTVTSSSSSSGGSTGIFALIAMSLLGFTRRFTKANKTNV